MRVVGLLLLAIVFYGYDPASNLFGGSAARWCYVLHGFGGMVLALCVALAVRDWTARFLFAWIAFEEALVGGCGAVQLFSTDEWVANPYTGLCGGVAETNLYKIGLFVTASFALWISLRWKRKPK